MNIHFSQLKKNSDIRGFLIEFLKKTELDEGKRSFGQIYCATLAPGTWRGNHYHKEKEEWIVILTGKAKMVFIDINNNERQEIIFDSSPDVLTKVRIGQNIAHTIKNISHAIVVIVGYATQIYDPKKTDSWEYEVLK